MKLTREGIKEREAWEKAGINLPGYDVEAVTEKAKKEPGWVHFGIGNIFRVFMSFTYVYVLTEVEYKTFLFKNLLAKRLILLLFFCLLLPVLPYIAFPAN